MNRIVVPLLCVLLFVSCVNQRKEDSKKGYTNQYATGFDIIDSADYTAVYVYNPWKKNEVLGRYYLVNNDSVKTPSDGIKFIVPLQKITLTSCTHIGFLKEIGCLDVVCGICNPQIVYNLDSLQSARAMSSDRSFEIVDVGDAMTPNVELIVHTAPDAVMVSTYAQGDAASEKLQKLGVPVIFNNEWTETHPLARAEWIRFVGAFFDKRHQADSVFEQVVDDYNALKSSVSSVEKKKTIMSGNNFRGTWYMPSGNTYMGVLFSDAAAKYIYQTDTSNFSLPLTIETVVEQFADADVWVGSSAKTLDELADIDVKHTWFKAYKTAQVYNFNKRTTPTGGNDFWETGVVHPDMILSDLIKILYPDSLANVEFNFTNHLE